MNNVNIVARATYLVVVLRGDVAVRVMVRADILANEGVVRIEDSRDVCEPPFGELVAVSW